MPLNWYVYGEDDLRFFEQTAILLGLGPKSGIIRIAVVVRT